jgi:hypothetical protein
MYNPPGQYTQKVTARRRNPHVLKHFSEENRRNY